MSQKRILVGLTGASGSIYGVKTVERLRCLGHEIHLIVSTWGEETLKHETGLTGKKLAERVHASYDNNDMSAAPASGSFNLDGMVIAPCSMKTLSAIANGYAENLMSRVADVTLKERRTLILVPRESPLNLIHIRNLKRAAEAGAIILPASPAFWHRPNTLDEAIDSVVERILSHLNVLEHKSVEWTGMP